MQKGFGCSAENGTCIFVDEQEQYMNNQETPKLANSTYSRFDEN
jgi:hypothetical protein